MREVNPLPFIGAIAKLRTLIERAASCNSDDEVSDDDRELARGALAPLLETFNIVGCRSAHVANERLVRE